MQTLDWALVALTAALAVAAGIAWRERHDRRDVVLLGGTGLGCAVGAAFAWMN